VDEALEFSAFKRFFPEQGRVDKQLDQAADGRLSITLSIRP